MKVIIIPIKRDTVIHLLVISFLILLLIFLNSGEAISVLNRALREPIYQGNSNNQRIAFECNVVWGTEYIAPMLDIFKEYDIRITFFVGGDWAKNNPQMLKQMVEEGHEIGNHGYSHKHHSKLSLYENRKEILDTEMVIESITGIKTRLFAPPYGEYNDTTIKAADSLGYRTIMWSIDTIDWRRDGKDKIIQRAMKNPHNGALVLMHPTADTISALPVIIEKLNEQGYGIGTVSEALAD